LVILVLLNDGTILTIAHDNVIPTKKPEAWKLNVIAGVAMVVGSVATMGLFGMYFMFTSTDEHSTHNVFGFPFDENCYYARGPFPGTDITDTLKDVQCSPLCPGYSADHKTCGEYFGWSEAITVIYMCLSVGGQLTVYIARTKHSFWSRRPGFALMTASFVAVATATILSVYWPVNFDIDAYVGIKVSGDSKSHPVRVVMHGIGWKMAGIIWGYCLGLFLLEDLIKVYFFYAVDNDDTPDDDIMKIKKEKKPFLPKLGGKSKKRSNNKKVKKPLLLKKGRDQVVIDI